jgi:hypothetical protein
LFFALFTPVCGFIAAAVLLQSSKIVPAVCNKLLKKKSIAWVSVIAGISLPFFHISLFMLVAFIKGISFPIGDVLARGCAMVLVSVPGFYLGATLASKVFGARMCSNSPGTS